MLTYRRITTLAAAALLLGSFVAEPVFAQATLPPPGGGIGSSTTPSNSEGTPSGGSGNLSSTRTQGAPGSSYQTAPGYQASPGTTTAAAQRRRARRRAARRTVRPAPQSSLMAPAAPAIV